MVEQGANIVMGVLPESIQKLPSGRLLVRRTDGVTEEFDTVLCAIGRDADTRAVGLDLLGAAVNPKNGKVVCVNEQTSVPHVYAIGDIVDGAPELTPVAIMAGRLLARRLFGAGREVTRERKRECL